MHCHGVSLPVITGHDNTVNQLLQQAADLHKGWNTPLCDAQTYKNRLATIQQELCDKTFDFMIVSAMEDIYWLTNFETLGAPAIQLLLIPAQGDVALFTRELEQANALRTYLSPEQVDGYRDDQDAFEQLCRFFSNNQLTPNSKQRIALQMKSDRLCAWHQQHICDFLPKAQFDDASDLITYHRQIKDEHELAIMHQVAKITETTMQVMIESLKQGINEHEVMALCHYTMFRAGSQYPAYPPFISFGESCALGHKTAEYKSLQPGDLGLLEIGPTIARYTVPMMRPIYCGDEPPQWLDELTDCVNHVIDTIHQMIKPGAIPAEIDQVARQMISKKAAYFKMHYGIEVTQFARNGYMVGVGFMPDWGKESASIGPIDFAPLRENMTMHIIPWVQLWKDSKPFSALMLSDTIHVTADGCESFFDQTPRQLFCVPTSDNTIQTSTHRASFASDNAAGFNNALNTYFDRANQTHALGYGNDEYTRQIQHKLCAQFDCDVALFMPTGTAANKLALAHLTDSTESIICSSVAHIYVDECGTIPNLVALTADEQGKIHVDQIREALNFYRSASPHRQWPTVISLSQPTEMGYCYNEEELTLITTLADEFDIQLHMDGARLANACVATGKSLEQMTDAFDAISFGATKNGTLGAEAVLLKNANSNKAYRLQKQMGFYTSKPRYLAAQIDCLLDNHRWQQHAEHANAMAATLARQLAAIDEINIVGYVETNMVYAKLPKHLHDELKDAFDYLAMPNSDGSVTARFVTAFNTKRDDIESLAQQLSVIANQVSQAV